MKQKIDKEGLQQALYELVRSIPKGRVCTYGHLAAALGAASGARLVGYLLALSTDEKPSVPAHRVVNSQGLLTGKFRFVPEEKMQQLLEKEGVQVVNDKVQNFKELLWIPVNEL